MKEIDFLSPPITLFYFERRTHTSKIGGLLVIFLIALITTYIFHIFISELSHTKVTSVFYKKYVNEAGYYSFNTTSLFHFIHILNSAKGNILDEYNHKNLRIYTISSLDCDNESTLETTDHWVFDSCKDGVDNKNIDESMFINIKNFSNGACIKYYYNSTEKQYFSSNNTKFKWPNLEHGTSNNKNQYVNTIVTKCSNSSISVKILGYCNSENEIDQYLKDHQAIYLYFIDNLIDVTNYNKPLQSYFYPINSNLGKGITYVDNYIHFSPIQLSTSEGLIFSNKKQLNSLSFDQNRKGEGKNSENSHVILSKYHHLLQNNIQIYERRYNNLFDIISDIGGVVQMLFYIFYGINYLYNSYIVLNDTNSIFFKIEKGGSRININIHDLKKILFDIEDDSNYDYNYKSSNNIKPLIGNIETNNKNFNINQNIKSINGFRLKTINNDDNHRKNNSLFGRFNIKKYSDIAYIPNKNYSFLNDSKKIGYFNDDSISNICKKFKNNNCQSGRFRVIKFFNSSMKINDNNNINNFKDKDNNKKLPKDKYINILKREISNKSMVIGKKFSFFICLKMICSKRIKNNLTILVNFRKKLLSEEHLFRSHLTSVLFEKHNQIGSKQSISFANFYNEL